MYYDDTLSHTIPVLKERINNQIRADELRVIDAEGTNIGVFPFAEALKMAQDQGLDLIEVNANAKPPIAKIMEFGKYQYELKKKAQKINAGASGRGALIISTPSKFPFSVIISVFTDPVINMYKASHKSPCLKSILFFL